MKRTILIIISLVISGTVVLCQTPIISMTSANDSGSTFTFVLRSWQPPASTTIQVDFGDGVLVSKTVWTDYPGTTITGTLGASKTVTVYGDMVAELNCTGQNLTEISFFDYIELSNIDCSDNQITELDLNNMPLSTLICENNQLTELDVSKNPKLLSLRCENNQLTKLNLDSLSKLSYFNCSDNQLTGLDVSKLSNLDLLYCSNNQISVLDFSKNNLLSILKCDHNKLSQLILPVNNVNLKQIDCENNLLKTLNVTPYTDLSYLYCQYNLITELNLANNTKLKKIYCNDNQLTSLNITPNSDLIVGCRNNSLSYATLPSGPFKYMEFAPQKLLQIVKRIEPGDILDLSTQFKVNDDTTRFTWTTKMAVILVEGIDYTNSRGKFTFLKPQTDSILCQLINNFFSGFTSSNWIATTYVKVDTISNLSVSETAIDISNLANSNGNFTISSNTTWQVISLAAWLTANPAAGSNDGAITLTAEANTAASSRSATITVSGTSVDSKEITVTQSGSTIIDGISQSVLNPVIYPNPANNLLHVSQCQDKVLKICNLSGVELFTSSVIEENETIDISTLLPGLYILSIDGYQIKLLKN